MPALRVLHVQKAAGVSGAERHVLALLPALMERGIQVEACVLVAGDGLSYVEQLRTAGVATHTLDAGPSANPLLVPRLASIAHRTRADLVHTHLVHADVHGALAARIAGLPVVSSVHGRPAFYEHEPYRTMGRAVGRLVARRIAISKAVAQFVERLGLARPGATEIIPYGIDTATWAAAAAAPGAVASARAALGIADGEVAVGIASRLIAGKGHAALIDATALAAARVPEVRLLVAGAGPLAADLAARARRVAPGRVRFLGYVADVRAFMVACDVIAFPAEPSLGEGFGLAALEAMATGRPVVATDSGALGELVVDGETGSLVPPEAPSPMAEALVRLAADAGLRARMGEAGQRRAAERYSLVAMVDATAEVYRSVAARS